MPSIGLPTANLFVKKTLLRPVPLVAITVILTAFLAFRHQDSLGTSFRNGYDSFASSSYGSQSGPRYCSLEELDQGSWKKRHYAGHTVDGVLALLEYRDWVQDPWIEPSRSHRADGVHCGVSSNEPDHLAKTDERIIAANSWEWEMDIDCEVRPWNYTKFARRLLSSVGGMALVGDSLSEQNWDAIAYRLGNQGPFYQVPGWRFLYFDTHHPDAKEILSGLPYVPGHQTRNITVLSQLRSDLHWDKPGVAAAIESLGLTGIVKPLEFHSLYDWVEPLDTLPTFLARHMASTDENEGVLPEIAELYDHSLPVEKTMVVMNQGAHWSSQSFTLNEDDESFAMWLRLYDLMIEEVMQVVKDRKDSLLFFYRATNIPHSSCDMHHAPIDDMSLYYNVGNKTVNGWGYFPRLNDRWRQKLNHKEWRDTAFFVDVETSTGTRPDTHRWPHLGDCLHLCVPSNIDQWGLWTWHQILGVSEAAYL